MKFEIVRGSVVDASVDAIVNAANNQLLYGDGVCGAIFEAAGFEDMQDECDLYEYCKTGEAIITHGYDLKAKWVIHAVGPVYYESSNPSEELKSAYLSSLKLADEYNLATIAFPCLSTGYFGYPLYEASKIAMETISEYVPKSLKTCYFYCYTIDEYLVYTELEEKNRCTK